MRFPPATRPTRWATPTLDGTVQVGAELKRSHRYPVSASPADDGLRQAWRRRIWTAVAMTLSLFLTRE